ncbi:MAG: hypothetical protein BWK76_17145 [Desulfobulbaceae bacterium A2]|nr:MAG: hypothetical protein BWK76_17145 [Desulfobulbaceae bacterium A2]
MHEQPAAYSAMDSPAALQVLFHPRRAPAGRLPAGAENIDVEVEPEVHLGCRLYLAQDSAAPLILYFHGNGEVVPEYDEIASEFTRRGMHLLLTTYRGYGWSGGRPTASLMMADAERLYQAVRDLMAVRHMTGGCWLMGRSLGSAGAIELAAIHGAEIAGLIIESGFADTLPLARTLGIHWADGRMTEEDGFRNAEKIGQVTRPTLIMHGSHDSLIPPWQAEKLAARSAATRKRLVLIDGAQHNSMFYVGGASYFETIRHFMDQREEGRDDK